MQETSAEGITTVELSGKQLHSYRDGAQVYVLYSELLQQFQLGNSISPSTLQRRKNKIVTADQFCPSKPLQQLQEAGVVRKDARKVAVLTVQEAVKLLQLYNITAIAEDESDAEMLPPLGDFSATPQPEPTVEQPSSSAAADLSLLASTFAEASQQKIDKPTEDDLAPPPPKRHKKSTAFDLGKHLTAREELTALKRYWTLEINHHRSSPPISEQTFFKTRERLLSELHHAYCNTTGAVFTFSYLLYRSISWLCG